MTVSRENRRKGRVRRALRRSAYGRLRLSVFRSSKHIYAQVIDDAKGETLAAASSMEKEIRGDAKTGAMSRRPRPSASASRRARRKKA